MIYSIYPQQDSTLYEVSESLNSGIDQILELRHDITDTNTIYNSRILIKFNLDNINRVISENSAQNPQFYLKLTSVDARQLPSITDIEIYPLSGSWNMGLGKLDNKPKTTNGVSWKYKLDEDSGVIWNTGSLTGNVTSSYKSNPGGGIWYTGSTYEASQSLTFESINIRSNVTSIVNEWISGSIENDGFILKRSDSDESTLSKSQNLSYYSVESNTIFVPRLEILWDDSTINTGSIAEVSESINISPRLRDFYTREGTYKVYINARKKYPQRTFATSSAYITNYHLPTSSYYQIEDHRTGEVIIPFDTTGTKLSVDSNGSYFKLMPDTFMPKRFYKVIFKVVTTDTIEYFDNEYTFKVK